MQRSLCKLRHQFLKQVQNELEQFNQMMHHDDSLFIYLSIIKNIIEMKRLSKFVIFHFSNECPFCIFLRKCATLPSTLATVLSRNLLRCHVLLQKNAETRHSSFCKRGRKRDDDDFLIVIISRAFNYVINCLSCLLWSFLMGQKYPIRLNGRSYIRTI